MSNKKILEVEKNFQLLLKFDPKRNDAYSCFKIECDLMNLIYEGDVEIACKKIESIICRLIKTERIYRAQTMILRFLDFTNQLVQEGRLFTAARLLKTLGRIAKRHLKNVSMTKGIMLKSFELAQKAFVPRGLMSAAEVAAETVISLAHGKQGVLEAVVGAKKIIFDLKRWKNGESLKNLFNAENPDLS